MDEEKVNILVVDDVPEKLVAFEAILEELGQNVVTAASGREALRRVLEQDFAVILLDVNMPGMDGFETASLIRQRKRSELTPIIFVTADSDETHASQGYSLGAVDYILAPVVADVLRAKVAVFVELDRKRRQIERQAQELVALAREQAARQMAEQATQRSMFLADASNRWSRLLDYDAAVRGVLQFVVPRLADFAAVDPMDEHGRAILPRHALWVESHAPTIRRGNIGMPLPAAEAAIQQAVLSQEAVFVEDLAADSRAPADASCKHATTVQSGDARDGPADAPADDHSLRSALVLPLIARGHLLGTLLLGMSFSERTFSQADRALAADLANRAAITLDNARLYREIREGDRRKDEFLAMLGHELRNPLGAVSNALNVLDDFEPGSPDYQAAWNILRRQVNQITRLVDDLLDVSRITRGKVELRCEPIELDAAIERAIAAVRPLIDGRGHQLRVALPEDRLTLEADPSRLEQILANLLSNAAKYTEPGGDIWLSASREQNQAVIRVRDSGVGIPPQLLPRVFDLFVQGDRSLDRTHGGLGIGLTLVRKLVELHGGRVEAHSPGPFQGSEFIVRMPATGRALDRDQTDKPATVPCTARRRVLLVDDNQDMLTATVMLLRHLGHHVRTAHDGPSALETALAEPPDVMLIDIGLPGMNGFEVARELRHHAQFDRVLLVAVTGYGQAEDQRRSRAAGFDHHLIKPVCIQTLQRLLAEGGPAKGVRGGSPPKSTATVD